MFRYVLATSVALSTLCAASANAGLPGVTKNRSGPGPRINQPVENAPTGNESAQSSKAGSAAPARLAVYSQADQPEEVTPAQVGEVNADGTTLVAYYGPGQGNNGNSGQRPGVNNNGNSGQRRSVNRGSSSGGLGQGNNGYSGQNPSPYRNYRGSYVPSYPNYGYGGGGGFGPYVRNYSYGPVPYAPRPYYGGGYGGGYGGYGSSYYGGPRAGTGYSWASR